MDSQVFTEQTHIEKAINEKLESSLSQKFTLDIEKCNKLFSFHTPKIDELDNTLFCKDITLNELRSALNQLRSGASPGLDAIPSSLYIKLFDLICYIQ